MHTGKIRILLADPETLFRQGLARLVEGHPGLELVAEALTGEEALRHAGEASPDVILLDPEGPGIPLCRALRDRFPSLPVVAVARSRNLARVLEALRAGAWGYVARDISFDHLAQCIAHVHREGRRGMPFLAEHVRSVPSRGPLSGRQREILALIAQGRGNREIAQALSISENTVRNHVANIFEKLRARDRTEAAIRGLRRGLI